MAMDASEQVERSAGAGPVTAGLQAHAHHAMEHERQDADQCVGANSLRQPVEHWCDLEITLEHSKAALDIGQTLVVDPAKFRSPPEPVH